MDKLIAKYCAVCRAENVVPLLSVDHLPDGWACSLVGVAHVWVHGMKTMEDAIKKAVTIFMDEHARMKLSDSGFNEEYRARFIARSLETYLSGDEVFDGCSVGAVLEDGIWRVIVAGPKDSVAKVDPADFPNIASRSEPVIVKATDEKAMRVLHPTDVRSASCGLDPLDPALDAVILH